MKSRLAIYLGNGLQSKDSETRLLALKLACSCCFNSRLIFFRLLPIFETTLYHEDCSMREYVLACLMDLIFIHHSTIRLQTVFHFISPFLYAPTPTLQLAAVIGCGKFCSSVSRIHLFWCHIFVPLSSTYLFCFFGFDSLGIGSALASYLFLYWCAFKVRFTCFYVHWFQINKIIKSYLFPHVRILVNFI